MNMVFSIGHSNLAWSQFMALLWAAEITALVDVRSSPKSRFQHFNRAGLKAGLNAAGIEYQFMGVELGGRPRCGGPADYEPMATNPLFIAGLDRIEGWPRAAAL